MEIHAQYYSKQLLQMNQLDIINWDISKGIGRYVDILDGT